jgi:hypothetical protein
MVFHEPLALITALQANLDAVDDPSPDAFDRFSQLIPAAWIEHALQATSIPASSSFAGRTADLAGHRAGAIS